ncbi:non-homologous end-joining DNA ligase [Nocardia aobensis]|uniref:non-homologous end-joining DNA ligase n=1 Tax=Nocardia aobensis TaxID=257277 RepID=UPI00278C196E|nr:non-homologous end-joining DNA ligase [Nocardia aobensis]
MGRVPAPMLATAGRPPENSDLWATEMKWDGMRAITTLDNGEARLYSRNGREATASFPELTAALTDTAAGRRLVIDGEIVAPELPTGIPSFRRLQHRMHIARPPAGLIASIPVQLFVFDVLVIDDTDTTVLTYVQRRDLLAELDLAGTLIRVPPYWTDIAPAQMLDTAAEHGLEGIVSKRLDSIYRPGQRSRSWIKTPLRRSADVVVAGWIPGSRLRSGVFGSLILGAHTPAGDLVYVGNVGTGFSMAQRRALQARLDEIARQTSPFASPPQFGSVPAYWVEPGLVATVFYREFTTTLRHPSWSGLRADRDFLEVRLPD